MGTDATEVRMIGFRMPAEAVQKFKLICVKNNVNISDVCSALVGLVVAAHGEDDVPQEISDKVKAVIGPVCKIQE